jgi:hypothetical protein
MIKYLCWSLERRGPTSLPVKVLRKQNLVGLTIPNRVVKRASADDSSGLSGAKISQGQLF